MKILCTKSVIILYIHLKTFDFATKITVLCMYRIVMHITAKLKFECESTVLKSGFLKRKILVESNLRGHALHTAHCFRYSK
jgi:hypothetical protein